MEQRRALAEEKERGAISRLHGIAELTKDTRGTVITLGGGSLFAVGKATLLPAAEKRLNELAVLLSEDPTRAITVLGHTDSKGIAATNRQLSQERADALRSYLIARGVAPERVRAVGMGDSKPVADNRSAKGRAENRRIELVLEEAQAT
jgi:outer membrane protein OmpA-like peptidoglycan-associated protein